MPLYNLTLLVFSHGTLCSALIACALPRKGHYGQMLGHVHLKGIGGPGAPHVFRLERLRDTGLTVGLE